MNNFTSDVKDPADTLLNPGQHISFVGWEEAHFSLF